MSMGNFLEATPWKKMFFHPSSTTNQVWSLREGYTSLIPSPSMTGNEQTENPGFFFSVITFIIFVSSMGISYNAFLSFSHLPNSIQIHSPSLPTQLCIPAFFFKSSTICFPICSWYVAFWSVVERTASLPPSSHWLPIAHQLGVELCPLLLCPCQESSLPLLLVSLFLLYFCNQLHLIRSLSLKYSWGNMFDKGNLLLAIDEYDSPTPNNC